MDGFFSEVLTFLETPLSQCQTPFDKLRMNEHLSVRPELVEGCDAVCMKKLLFMVFLRVL